MAGVSLLRSQYLLAAARVILISIGFLALPRGVEAQTLQAFDDRYGIPFAATLQVDAFGVLDNDLLDGENAGESGATVTLVLDVSHGVLVLGNDGSFSYEIGPSFDGTDEFVYRAEFGGVSSEALVTLSACEGVGDLITCWHETAFLEQVATLGYVVFREGFEADSVWGGVRTPLSAPSVASLGIEWRSNHPDPPASNPISTTSVPTHSGQWAIYDPEHGFATGTPTECDIDVPPEHCLHHDGFTGIRQPGHETLHAVGGYVSGTYGARVGIRIDGGLPTGGGKLTGGGHGFFGVIDARPAGFTEFQYRELDGKIGQAFYIFGDDFVFATAAATGVGMESGGPVAPALFVSPNPARLGSTIEFSLDRPARIRLAVFSLSGRRVRQLSDDRRSGGRHRVFWDGRDEGGSRARSGIYFLRMTVEEPEGMAIATAKLLLMR